MMKKNKTDKRTLQANTGYKGKQCPKDAYTHAYTVKVRDAVKDTAELAALEKFFDYKAKKFKEDILDKPDIIQWAIEHCDELARGAFRKELLLVSEKPYLKHDTKCNNAWYFYNDSALLEQSARSLNSKIIIAHICEKHDWDADDAAIICEEIHNANGKWVSHAEIRNTCSSKAIPSFNTEMRYSLDYGTQSKYTIEDWSWDPDNPFDYHQTLLIGNASENVSVHFDYKIPERIFLQPYDVIDIRKPKLYRDDESGELMASIPYWFKPREMSTGNGALGGDAGICRVMKCGVVFPDGKYIENIAMSREVEQNHHHIQRLMENKQGLYKKYEAISALLNGRCDVESEEYQKLACKRERIYEEYSRVRSNISAERRALSFLIARDMLVLVRQFGCDTIHLERLGWVGGNGQSWNFAELRRSILSHAERYGVRVLEVSAYKTSQNDPSCAGVELVGASDTDARVCEWSDGRVHDRDDSAGLEIACRVGKYSSVRDRDAVVSCDVVGEEREYAPELGEHTGTGKRVSGRRRRVGRSRGLDMSYRPDLDGFYSSIRERRRELAVVRGQECCGGGVFDVRKWVVGASGTVARLCRCRLLSGIPEQSRIMTAGNMLVLIENHRD